MFRIPRGYLVKRLHSVDDAYRRIKRFFPQFRRASYAYTERRANKRTTVSALADDALLFYTPKGRSNVYRRVAKSRGTHLSIRRGPGTIEQFTYNSASNNGRDEREMVPTRRA